MKDENIDELLNSFLDDELTQRQRTEVERLIMNDKKLEERFREIERCKMLVSSLPAAAAPAEMMENISKLIEKRSLLGESSDYSNVKKASRHLAYRKMAAAAAMIALMSVLGIMVYKIVIPSKDINQPLAYQPVKDFEASTDKVVAEAQIPDRFDGRIELFAIDTVMVNSVVRRALKDNNLREEISSQQNADKTVYVVKDTPEKLSNFVADLAKVWGELNRADLLIQYKGDESVVEWVHATQIEKIFKKKSLMESVRLAKEFSVANNSAGQEGAKIAFRKDKEDSSSDLLSVPKPVLAGKEKTKQIEYAGDREKIELTIVVVGTK